MHVLDRNGVDIDAFETAHVDRPEVWCGARSAKWQDAASWAEVILRSARVPLIDGQIFE